MPTRTNISSGAPCEALYGHSRAVRVGNLVFVAGSTAIQADGSVVGVGDPYAQTRQTLQTIERALQQAGSRPRDVARTRLFVTNLVHTEAIGKAPAEVFGSIRPASTLVEISRLIHPDMLIEIEADAVIGD